MTRTRSAAEVAEEAYYDSNDADAQILDLCSGYGGAARYLARRFDCKV